MNAADRKARRAVEWTQQTQDVEEGTKSGKVLFVKAKISGCWARDV